MKCLASKLWSAATIASSPAATAEPLSAISFQRSAGGDGVSVGRDAASAGRCGNVTTLSLDGPRTIVVLNGVKVTDYKDGDPVPDRKFDFEPQHGPRPNFGYIGLQNHSDNDIVFFKEVAIKPVKN